MDRGFSSIHEDIGYTVMDENSAIDKKFPYKKDIDPRLIRFMRTSYYYKVNNIVPCIPMELEFRLRKKDWKQIYRYIKKYDVNL